MIRKGKMRFDTQKGHNKKQFMTTTLKSCLTLMTAAHQTITTKKLSTKLCALNSLSHIQKLIYQGSDEAHTCDC